MSRQSLDSKQSVVSPRGANLKYAFLLITKDNYNKFCRGVIASSIHDQACAKELEGCAIASHSKKHDKVKVNYVYITTTGSNDANRKFFNPSEYCEQVLESDVESVTTLLKLYNEKLTTCEQTEQVATELFLEFVSDLLMSKVTKATEDGGSEQLMEDEISMVLVGDDNSDDLELVEMLTAKEEDEDNLELENPELLEFSSLGKKENTESKLTVKTSTSDGIKAKIPKSVSSTTETTHEVKENPALKTHFEKFSTSKEFILRFQNSTDGGAGLLQALCERLITLENYTRTSIRPKVLKNTKSIQEVEQGFNVLFNPNHPTQRLDSMQLQLDSFQEDSYELSE
jgi:hypothetical protein